MRAESFNNLCVDRSFCGTHWLQNQAGQKLHLHLWLDTHLEDSLIVWQDSNRLTPGDYEIMTTVLGHIYGTSHGFPSVEWAVEPIRKQLFYNIKSTAVLMVISGQASC